MAQRISRAKQSIKAAGATFRAPTRGRARRARSRVVLHVLYLVFNEGYTTSSGDDLQRADLTAEAIRLTRMLHAQLPDDGEVSRPARAHAAHRRAPRRTHARRRRARPARRAGPVALGPRTVAEGVELLSAVLAARAARSVPAAGRDRGRPRRGPERGRHRLGRDPRALRAPRPRRAEPDGDAQPRRRRRRGARARRRARAARVTRRRRSHRRAPPHVAVRAHLLERVGDVDRRPRRLPRGRPPHDVTPGTAPPRIPRRPPRSRLIVLAPFTRDIRRARGAKTKRVRSLVPLGELDDGVGGADRGRPACGRGSPSPGCGWGSRRHSNSATVASRSSTRKQTWLKPVPARLPDERSISFVGLWKCRSCTSWCGSASGMASVTWSASIPGMPMYASIVAPEMCTCLITSKPSTPKNWIASSRSNTATVTWSKVGVAAHACPCSRPLVELHVVALRILEEHAAHETRRPARRTSWCRRPDRRRRP